MSRALLPILAVFLTACPALDAPRPPTSIETATIHKHACQAKGEVLIEKDQTADEPCAATALRLRALVASDPDCLAYYGDAGVEVDLCGPKAYKMDGGAK